MGEFIYNNNKYSVYVGKFRKEFGYAEFFKGRTGWFLGAKVLAKKQCKVGDRVIVKENNRVVKTGRVVFDRKHKSNKDVVWD